MPLKDRVKEYTDKAKDYVPVLKDKKDKVKKYAPHAFATAGALFAAKSVFDLMQAGDTDSIRYLANNIDNPIFRPSASWLLPYMKDSTVVTTDMIKTFYTDKIVNSVEQLSLSAEEALAAVALITSGYVADKIKNRKQK